MTEQEMLQNFLDKLNNVKKTGKNKYQASCPAHDDKNPSLSITLGQDNEGNDKINFYCHANCSDDDILEAIGLKWNDIYSSDLIITDKYVYLDEKRNPVHQTLKTADKNFPQKRHENGSFKWELSDIQTIIYRLPGVLEAIDKEKAVYLCEGEKDADNVAGLCLTATTSPLGTGSWKDHYNNYFAGGKVAILPDNDKEGINHAEEAASQLIDVVELVKVLKLPDLPQERDVSDWLESGGSKDELVRLVKDCQLWEADSQQGEKQRQFEDFLPSPSAREIIKQEKKKGVYGDMLLRKICSSFMITQGIGKVQIVNI